MSYQLFVEEQIGLTVDEAQFVNRNRDLPVVKVFCGFLIIASTHLDEPSLVVCLCSLADIRKLIAALVE